jgi:mRNA interferase RelE/StbE
MHRVEFTRKAGDELRSLDANMQQRASEAIDGLRNNPRPPGCKKLHGEKSVWRIRIGSFRIVYQVRDDQLQVLIIKIAHRKDVYR